MVGARDYMGVGVKVAIPVKYMQPCGTCDQSPLCVPQIPESSKEAALPQPGIVQVCASLLGGIIERLCLSLISRLRPSAGLLTCTHSATPVS